MEIWEFWADMIRTGFINTITGELFLVLASASAGHSIYEMASNKKD